MKVMIIVGTRPELIRLSRVIAVLRSSLDCVLVHTGQNFSYELGEIFYGDLGIAPPDHYLGAVGETLAETISLIISRVDRVLESEKPDAVLVLGDTNSALSVISAKRRKIPIFHYEAGNRCFDQRVPEEINRQIVDHTSDINLAYSDVAKQNLLREGLPMDRIFNIGSPMREVLDYYRDRIETAKVLEKLGLESGKYFVLSAHREENVDNKDGLLALGKCIKGLLDRYPYPVFFSVHPRTHKRLSDHGISFPDRVIQSKPLGFTDYVALQKKAFCVLSDSGTISEESAILGFPAVNIRETHERIEGMEKAVVPMTGFHPEFFLLGIEAARRQVGHEIISPVPDYMEKNISEKILRIVLSYTPYINRVVWRKHEP